MAVGGQDYTATSGTLSFAPGETVKNVTIAITNDAIAEGAETFALTLSSPTNATLADAVGIVTIGANDATPVASPRISASADIVVGEGDGYVDVPVTLSAPGQTVVTVGYSTYNNTATAPADYTGVSPAR